MCQASNKMENEQTNRTIEILKLLRQSKQILSETLIWPRLDFTQIRYHIRKFAHFQKNKHVEFIAGIKNIHETVKTCLH